MKDTNTIDQYISEFEFNTISAGAIDNMFLFRHQNKLLSKQCYELQRMFLRPNTYSVSARGEYSLANANKTGYNITSQISEIRNGTLERVVCVKSCEIGYFYEFESISCRKCNLGCGVCKSFDNCEDCIPGFNKIKATVDHLDMQVGGYPVGLCRPGRQPGFYPKRFDGKCTERPKSCRVCRDKVNKEVEKSKEKGIEDLIYCIQCREKDESGAQLYADLLTGECVKECEGFGFFTKNVTSSTEGNTYLACGKCFDPFCKDCNQSLEEEACVACKDGYVLDKDGSCKMYWNTTNGIMIITSISLTIVLITIMICLVCLSGLMNTDSGGSLRGKGKEKLRQAFKTKMKGFRVVCAGNISNNLLPENSMEMARLERNQANSSLVPEEMQVADRGHLASKFMAYRSKKLGSSVNHGINNFSNKSQKDDEKKKPYQFHVQYPEMN